MEANGAGSDPLVIGGRTFTSRLFTGTGKFASAKVMEASLIESGTQLVTVALRRVDVNKPDDEILSHLKHPSFHLLPNTSGARDAREAIFAAELSREALETNWLKLEIHPDPKWLLPDPIETLKAAEDLVKRGFVVLPYIHADPVLCKRLEAVGVAAVMPLGAPIGSHGGLQTRDMLRIIIAQSKVPVVVDAGIGAPSHAAEAMELGADAVLINTAMAVARDPLAIARAYRMAVEAGRLHRLAGGSRGPSAAVSAEASSPLTAFLDHP